MRQLNYTPLAFAMATLLSTVAYANDTADSTDLGTLTVTTDRQGAKVKTNVVTTATKDESTATDLRGLLQGEPSIDFSGGNGTSSYLTIRGMGQNSVDVKVDNAYSDTQILYHQGRHMLDPSLVKIVSVQKGAGAASAGIGQTNGAIVAKTLDAADLLKGSDKSHGFKVNVGYSTNKEFSQGMTAFAKAGNFDFLLSANYTNQENYKAGAGTERIANTGELAKTTNYENPITKKPNDKTVPYSALDKYSYLAKAGATFGNHRFVLSHFNTVNSGIRNIREEFNMFGAGQDPQYRKLSLANTNLEYKGQDLGFIDTVEANVYHMVNTRQSADDKESGYAGKFAGKNTTHVTTTGANIGFDTDLSDRTLIKYGLNYRHQEVVPNRRLTATDTVGTPPKALGYDVVNQEKTDVGVYAEAIHNIGNVTLTGGLRYDRFDFKDMTGKKVSNGAVSPSVGIIYQATPNLSFNVSHNHATRSPRPYDALTAHGARATVFVSDNVKAEKAKNSEIGFNYDRGNLAVSGSYFWQEIEGLLNSGRAALHGTGGDVSSIQNIGKGTNKGYEVNARYNLGGLTARIGVAHSDPKFDSTASFSNREYGARVGRTYTLGLTYRFAKPNLEVGVNHRKVDDVVGQSLWTSERLTPANRQNLPNQIRYGYHITDIYANWKPYGSDKMNVNFAVNNVADRFYIPHTNSSGLPGVGREFRVGFNYTY